MISQATTVTKKCLWCGKEFTGGKRRKYCSPECSDQARREKNRNNVKLARQREKEKNKKVVICPVCGKKFETNKSNRKYCSKKCARKKPKRWDNGPRVCPVCGNSFIPYNPQQKYCSYECAQTIKLEKVRLYNSGGKTINPKGTVRCIDCMDPEYIPVQCRRKGQTSCFTCSLPVDECHG